MSIKLFSIDDNLDLIINKNELFSFPSFRNIVKKVTPIEGDSDGRKKEYAKRELAYIYHIADIKSLPNTKRYNKKSAHAYATSKAGLPITYEPSADVLRAIEDYKGEQSTIGSETINEMIKTFNLTEKIIKTSRESIEEYLNKGKLNKDDMKEMLGLLQNVITFSNEVPRLIKDLYTAMIEAESKDSNVELIRGSDDAIPDSANPETSY